jgi:hypothetical protein
MSRWLLPTLSIHHSQHSPITTRLSFLQSSWLAVLPYPRPHACKLWYTYLPSYSHTFSMKNLYPLSCCHLRDVGGSPPEERPPGTGDAEHLARRSKHPFNRQM